MVPDITNTYLDKGIKIASKHKFKVLIKKEISDSLPKNYIAIQFPKNGEIALQNSKITVFLSKGDKGKILSDFTGMKLKRVLDKLSSYNVRVETLYVDTISAGHVVRTIPSAGSYVIKQDTIIVYVNGIKFVKVPDVRGKNFKTARKILENEGLKVVIRSIVNYHYREGTVFYQSLQPGTKIKKGERIVIKYARLFR